MKLSVEIPDEAAQQLSAAAERLGSGLNNSLAPRSPIWLAKRTLIAKRRSRAFSTGTGSSTGASRNAIPDTCGDPLCAHRLMQESGGPPGVRDLGLVESAVAQPYGSFGGQDLYPSLVDKAAALAYSLVKTHPFVDGNKRVAHASMEVF
jgi:hypothetical protein